MVTYHHGIGTCLCLCCSSWDDHHLLPYVLRSLQGVQGDIARSLGEDATLGNVLQTLDRHCGAMMTFNALSKELYSLKQGMEKNVAKSGECLFQQVQILQMEYLSRIQLEHVEEVKWNCFCEGLSPEYWWMPAHMVNGENPVTCSKLLLAAQKLERQVEATDPLHPKVTTAGSSNVTHSYSKGNLFPSRKLKGRLLHNILLLINCYIGNISIECHSRSCE